ncbi:cell division cycle protein 27 homolog B isoform X1 [Gossypium hirsutum]|uniref:Cell division cycle protein 27 homolog B isoform X1 n=2 Tax=Gossypium hirsutum TaxID=3635 RepID=A0ABM2ZFY2_GOSHI|nr:cell division cycle protein 27 homolog B-like isoform X1 [Gossypium hirsutum]
MEAILTDCVQNSLRHFMFKNAIFFCERLCAEFPSEVNLQLLAASYLQNNQAYSAYHILKGMQTSQSRYLFAISCFQMDLLNEAETTLCPSNEPGGEIPNGAAGHYLLGLIYRYTDRKRSAIHHFRLALSIDPLLWSAYEELCILGAAEEATVVFGEAAALCIEKQYFYHGLASPNLHVASEGCNLVSSRNFSSEDVSRRQLKNTQVNSLRDIPSNHHGAAISASQPHNGGPSNISLYNTPSPVASQLSGVVPPPLCRNAQPNGSNLNTVNADGSPKSVVNSLVQAPRRKFVDEGKLQKISGRLFSDSGPRRSTRLAGDAGVNTNANTTGVAGNGTSSSKYLGAKLSSVALRTVTVRNSQYWANDNIEEGIRAEIFDDIRANLASANSSSSPGDVRSLDQDEPTVPVGGVVTSRSKVSSGVSEVLGLLKTLGEGYRLSCLYRCQDALNTFLTLPLRHYNTSWVLSQVGKAHFELIDYLEADRVFSLSLRVSPYSLEGMDIYSTVLYHLKEDMKLSYLARELISTDRLAPQSWCAMGNCYSLQKDHKTAVKIFQRSVQLNTRFAYAHTLCGHEYVALEDFENGIKSYQDALQIDSRHYNAWYGLGMIFLRQEKFEFSEHHFRTAFLINPRSSVILSYLGTALHALKRSEDAIKIMDCAIFSDRKNPLPMYQKANILMSLEKFDEALEVLQELKGYAPRESSVYALMGKIYKRQNMHEKAMLHFGIALDLKPSATDVATIKAAIEKLHVPDELED